MLPPAATFKREAGNLPRLRSACLATTQVALI